MSQFESRLPSVRSPPSDDGTLSDSPTPKPATVWPTLPTALKAGAILILAFWINALWLFGSSYRSVYRTDQLNVIVADFDGAGIGSALLAAVDKFNGQPIYPTFQIYPANETSPQQILDEVWSGRAWGAVFATAGASNRLEAALSDTMVAASYVAADALVYTGLEARYSSVWSGYLLTNIMAVTQATMKIFNVEMIDPLSQTLDTAALSPVQLDIYFNPISSTFNNLTPFTFTAKSLYNTIGTVLPILFQFFFLLTLNGIYQSQGIWGKVTHRHLVMSRFIKGPIWTLLSSLSVVGWQVAFDENLGMKAKNFFAMWATTWVFTMGVFDLLDGVTTFVPTAAQIPVTLSIIIMSVASTTFPIELCAPFFRIHYMFPAHAMWETNITVWTGGAANRLYYDLPVLAVWFIVGKVLVVFAMKKRISDARKAAKGKNTPATKEVEKTQKAEA